MKVNFLSFPCCLPCKSLLSLILFLLFTNSVYLSAFFFIIKTLVVIVKIITYKPLWLLLPLVSLFFHFHFFVVLMIIIETIVLSSSLSILGSSFLFFSNIKRFVNHFVYLLVSFFCFLSWNRRVKIYNLIDFF